MVYKILHLNYSVYLWFENISIDQLKKRNAQINLVFW